MQTLGTMNKLDDVEAVRTDLEALGKLAKTPYARQLLMRNMSLATARLEALRKEEEAKVARGRPGHAPWAADFWQDGKGGGEKGSGEGSSGAAPPPPPEPARRAPAEAPGVFGKYSWDQSDRAVTLYFPVDAPTAEETSHEFTEVGVRVTHARAGAAREFKLANLCHPIDKFKSKLLLKKDRIQAKMVKYVPGEEWSALDDVEDKKKAERQIRIQDGDLKDASTQELLADMFKNANDQERADLIKAAGQGQSKRDANRAAGGGGAQ